MPPSRGDSDAGPLKSEISGKQVRDEASGPLRISGWLRKKTSTSQITLELPQKLSLEVHLIGAPETSPESEPLRMSGWLRKKTPTSQITLELPQKLSLEVHLIGPPETSPQKVLLSPEKIAVEVHKASETKTWGKKLWDFLKDLGPVVAGIALVVVTFLVGHYTDVTSQRQAQAAIIADLGETDQTKRAMAAVKLAQYGKDALPVITSALGEKVDVVRENAAMVMAQMLVSREELRSALFDSMLRDFKETRNSYLRIGILRCLLEMEGRLNETERERVANLLTDRLGPKGERCNDHGKDEQELILAAELYKMLSLPVAKQLLVGILDNCGSELVRIQGVRKLEEIAKQTPAEREGIRQSLIKRQQKVAPESEEATEIRQAVEAIQRMRP